MKNITLAIDETVLAKVRRAAAKRDTTVNALVRDYLQKFSEQEDRSAKARQGLLELSQRSTWDPGPDWKWSREDTYDRPGLRRLKRSDIRSIKSPKRTQKKDNRG
jgi:hypothetical protein